MSIVPMLIVQVVAFVALAVFMRWLVAKHATTATAHLQELSQDYVQKQEQLKARAEEVERNAKAIQAKAQEEADQLKARTLEEVETARQQRLDQARQEAERIIQQANRAREALRQELVQSSEARVLARACALLQEVVPTQFFQAIHAQWVDELLQNGLISAEPLKRCEEIREVRVTSTYPLTPAQQKRLLERLHAILGDAVSVHEAVDPKLIAGMTIVLGHLVLEGSLASKLREAARHEPIER